jgi:hypothetical protein
MGSNDSLLKSALATRSVPLGAAAAVAGALVGAAAGAVVGWAAAAGAAVGAVVGAAAGAVVGAAAGALVGAVGAAAGPHAARIETLATPSPARRKKERLLHSTL